MHALGQHGHLPSINLSSTTLLPFCVNMCFKADISYACELTLNFSVNSPLGKLAGLCPIWLYLSENQASRRSLQTLDRLPSVAGNSACLASPLLSEGKVTFWRCLSFFFFLNKESFWIVGCRDCCWASWAAFRVALLFGSPDAMEGGKGKGREEV